MALGGGTFTAQNKVLPGSYINVVSASRASATLGERGVVAMPYNLTWGNPGEVITVTAEEFITDSMKIFGYAYSDDAMRDFREVFKHAQKVHVYNLAVANTTKASCNYGTAKKAGDRGNNLKIVIQKNIDNESLFDVTLYLGNAVVLAETVATIADLPENDYVVWSNQALAVTAGLAFTGASYEPSTTAEEQAALNALESYNFNVLAPSGIDYVDLYIAFTKRMRDTVGVKFQTIIGKYMDADYEGVVQLPEHQNNAKYWVAGALAGCAVNKSCTNMLYDGELTISCTETQTELEQRIKDGMFVFHKVEDEVRVLVDINSFVSVTDEKNELFSSNQTIRVIDERANTSASIFNKKYLGKVHNDASGRISFWSDLVSHAKQLETLRAIENYNSDDLKVLPGEKKTAVSVQDALTIVGTMEKLYMTTVIS